MATAMRDELSLSDRLSHLTYAQACQLLGPKAKELLREGGAWEVDPDEQARLERDRLVVSFPSAEVTITLSLAQRARLEIACSRCGSPCLHQAAALALVLEEKTSLGLAEPPPERVPAEWLSEAELVERALREREERARTERMTVRSTASNEPWTDYVVTSSGSGKTYRVALRGFDRGSSYCSCPDFRKNTLGTCKHILCALRRIQRRFSPQKLRRRYRRQKFSVYLRYDSPVSLRLGIPDTALEREVARVAEPLQDRAITDFRDLMARVSELERLGHDVTIYPDAEEFIDAQLLRNRLRAAMAEVKADPVGHPLRSGLLRAELLPYQLEGIAFGVAAGRAVLADEMGLGKTIQAIGVAELLAREAGIERVLVVCPASVKSQWNEEIARFTMRGATVILGSRSDRARQYAEPQFFTICNYEQVLRDLSAIASVRWDLIVLDEAQRIKNWEAKTSRTIKSLRSRFALALTGTPLENRLDDLYSIVEFIDEHRLGPAFRFFYQYRTVNEKGRVLGYQNLSDLRDAIAPVLLRRTRESVIDQLPDRTTQIIRIAPTQAQVDLHTTHIQMVARIVRKKFLTEMDLMRLQKALLMCRLAANGSFLVDRQHPGESSKLDRLAELLDQFGPARHRKLLIFSEWTRMLDRIEPLLEERGLASVRLDGSVAQQRRRSLVQRFSTDPDCRAFLTTNAGAVGLNLQAANTVINVDLPWNPAVLEQRIGRAHRMGQRHPVHVYALITEDTIEENLLSGLHAKAQLALAVLDPDSHTEAVDVGSAMEELRGRLEILLGRKPAVPQDHVQRERIVRESEAAHRARRDRVSEAGGQLIGAAVSFLSSMIPDEPAGSGLGAPPTAHVRQMAEYVKKQLRECVDQDADGRPVLRVRLQDQSTLDQLGEALARLMAPHLPPYGGSASES